MLNHWNDFEKNSFNVYWMRIEDGIVWPWINAMEKLPAKEDADAQNCVLSLNGHGEISITGYHQFGWNSGLLYWQRLPAPPSDYKELRRIT